MRLTDTTLSCTHLVVIEPRTKQAPKHLSICVRYHLCNIVKAQIFNIASQEVSKSHPQLGLGEGNQSNIGTSLPARYKHKTGRLARNITAYNSKVPKLSTCPWPQEGKATRFPRRARAKLPSPPVDVHGTCHYGSETAKA